MIIRPVRPQDAPLIDEISTGTEAGSFFGRNFGKTGDGARMIEALTRFDHVLVLEDEEAGGALAGVVALITEQQTYLRISASLRIMASREYRGRGAGRTLMDAALALADNELMLERVEMEIPTDNINALKLCKSSGFRVEGIAKDWMRTEDGRYVDAYLMARCRGR